MTKEQILDEAMLWTDDMTEMCSNLSDAFTKTYVFFMKVVEELWNDKEAQEIGVAPDDIVSAVAIIDALLEIYSMKFTASDGPDSNYYAMVATVHDISMKLIEGGGDL